MSVNKTTDISQNYGQNFSTETDYKSNLNSQDIAGDFYVRSESSSDLLTNEHSRNTMGRNFRSEPTLYIARDIGVDSSGWTHNNTSKGVKIYKKYVSRNINGEDKSLTVFKGFLQNVSGVSIEQFKTAVMDVKNYKGNIDYVQDIKVLNQSTDSVTYYQTLDFDVLGLSIRHAVLTIKVEEETTDKIRISFNQKEPVSTYKSQLGSLYSDKYVETGATEGYWEYDKATGTVTYVLLTEPGGSVSAGLTNMGTNISLPKTVTGMVDYAKTK